ncbi:MAG TPA: carbonic anhydrase [Noviherbaspirillum sp.]|uniref:carbonic anhydrase n=1 Tax=Noviherbaspirillum sp. TaxID=1926288 RepID=UPI002DDD2F82|nr:carbonic anhydrase [Noviherbaspirillum sp.]HEV2612882.1 carbonic anhydrase [Noviherbaspirillum sp.]
MPVFDKTKRNLFKKVCCGSAALGAGLFAPYVQASGGKKTTLTAAQALAALKEGNEKFLLDNAMKTNQGRERRLEIARGQAPMAVVVSCADSRVAPELLFNCGLGELFVVRNAGNTVDTVAQGSIEYAVAELGVPLIVVMGHERCGAVNAAMEVVEKNATFPGSIGPMIEPIVPSVLKAKASLGPSRPYTNDALLDASVRENVMRVVNRLRASEALLLEPSRSKKLMIVGARYDLDEGRVEFFESAPSKQAADL